MQVWNVASLVRSSQVRPVSCLYSTPSNLAFKEAPGPISTITCH